MRRDLVLAGQQPANSNFGWDIINIASGDVVEIVFNNHDGGQHPLHLHGERHDTGW
jgi:FtsP/CotA-like multicopper oxidase with cupredoxin domain